MSEEEFYQFQFPKRDMVDTDYRRLFKLISSNTSFNSLSGTWLIQTDTSSA